MQLSHMKPRPHKTIFPLVLVLGVAGFAPIAATAEELAKPSAGSAAQEQTLLAAVTEASHLKATDPQIAKAQEALANYYSGERRYAEAEKAYQKALEWKEDMLGRAKSSTAGMMAGLARPSMSSFHSSAF